MVRVGAIKGRNGPGLLFESNPTEMEGGSATPTRVDTDRVESACDASATPGAGASSGAKSDHGACAAGNGVGCTVDSGAEPEGAMGQRRNLVQKSEPHQDVPWEEVGLRREGAPWEMRR